jgi:hypothetical protein
MPARRSASPLVRPTIPPPITTARIKSPPLVVVCVHAKRRPPFSFSAIFSTVIIGGVDHDLSLIEALDALLAESSVTKAAARLHTSAPAMSRALARLRRAFDDPLLVRAGRDLVPTARALELRGEVHAVATRARALFSNASAADPRTAVRMFDLQVSDMLSTMVIPTLIHDLRVQAPGSPRRTRGSGDRDHRQGRTGDPVGNTSHHQDRAHELLRERTRHIMTTVAHQGEVRAAHRR